MFFDTVSDLLKHKRDDQPHAVAPTSPVADAVRLMNCHGIGAVLVINGRGLEGILTERDVMRRVVEPRLDPAATRVDEVMTPRPKTVCANDRAAHALEFMTKDGFRHLPVLDDGRVLGVLSMRDLNQWLTRELQEQADGALMTVKTMGLANRCR
jgi:CBS domain-containing protein